MKKLTPRKRIVRSFADRGDGDFSVKGIGAMRISFPVPVAFFVLLSSCMFAQTPPATPGNLTSKVDAVFQKMDSTVSPGCSLSVMKDGKIIYERGYGMADLDHNIPNTPTTVFHVASMSKQFTAASILLLAQQGKRSPE